MESINDYLIEQVANEKIKDAKILVATLGQLEEEYAMQLESARIAEQRHEKSKEGEYRGEYLDDLLEEKHMLRLYEELIYVTKKKVNKIKPVFNVPFGKLLNSVGNELDKMYSSNEDYRKIPVFHVVRYDNQEYDDDGEYTIYSHEIHSGFKTRYPMKDYRFSPVTISYPFSMSKEYILTEENINLLDCGAIGARSGEYANEDWQGFFYNLCREQLKDKVHNRENEFKEVQTGQEFLDKAREILDRNF